MATYTENYNLIMPEESDCYNVEPFNENFESIDTLMAENEAISNEINEKIGSPNDSGADTLFGRLGTGSSVIKSIQRKTYTVPASTSHNTISINEIDATKSFVIFERLYGSDDYTAEFTYSLTNTAISVSHGNYGNAGRIIVGFWIIEFN